MKRFHALRKAYFLKIFDFSPERQDFPWIYQRRGAHYQCYQFEQWTNININSVQFIKIYSQESFQKLSFQQTILLLQLIQQFEKMIKQINVKLQKDEELSPQFLDLFSKVIINSAEYISGLHYEQRTDMKYAQLYEYLTNSTNLKHNGLKSTISKLNQSLRFNFESKSNSIIFMLDLSPYMLIYNYGTKSFPLKNMQEIVINLLKKLANRKDKDNGNEIKIAIYLFSVYKKEFQIVLLNEQICQNCVNQVCQFINLTIQKSVLPYSKDAQKCNISELIQKVFNFTESDIGMKSLVMISSFNQQQHTPITLFTPNWYSYALINTGGHFGSYFIQNNQLRHNLVPGIFFKTKYVFKAHFLQNWQMTDIAKRENPDITKPITEKFRSIQFEHEGQICGDIFSLLLMFQIEFKGSKVSKMVGGAESVISTIRDNPNKVVLKSYRIPADSFIFILRTRYIQGWQPVMMTSNSMAVENSKFKLRMPIDNDHYMYYEASRVKSYFQISIHEIAKPEDRKDVFRIHVDKSEMLNMIEKMDKLNSYNFVTIINENLKINQSCRHTVLNNSLFHQNHQNQIFNYLCNYKDWGKFFKLKRTCFRFEPFLNQTVLEEFINEINFILGKRISNNIFIKQTQIQRKNQQKVDEIESTNRRLMLTKLNIYGNILELQLAFLRFSFEDIKSTQESIVNKIHGRKFKKGIVAVVMPNEISLVYKNEEIANNFMFNKKWSVKFKASHYKNLFKVYWQQVIRKMNYEEIFIKSGQNSDKFYYKVIEVLSVHSKKVEKVTFLKVNQVIDKNQLQFQISFPPNFSIIKPTNMQSTSKQIFVHQLLNFLGIDLKKTQQNIIKLIDTYQTIHYRLLKSVMTSPPKAINKKVEEEITNFYDNRTYAFPPTFNEACRQIIGKYYRQSTKELYHMIPVPTKSLMNTELDSVQGDINLQIDGKSFSIFLCSPFKFLYLYKKEKTIYYKFVNMFYLQFNHRENQNYFLELIKEEVIYRINEQIYKKDFKIFLDGNFKGGIVKIINNQLFTHLEERQIRIEQIFSHCDKYYISSVARGSLEQNRLRDSLIVYAKKMFSIIEQFFPLKRVNYYFQIRNKEASQATAPFEINPVISRYDTSLFMRMHITTSDQCIDVTPQNLPDFIIRYNSQIFKNNCCIAFKFYLKAKNNNEKSMAFLNYFTDTLNHFCKQMSYEIERILITKKQTLAYNLQNFAFLRQQYEQSQVRLDLIHPQCQKVQSLCKNIDDPVMQKELSFKRVRQSTLDYLIIQEQNVQKNIIFVEQPVIMKPSKGKLWFQYRRYSRFFAQQQKKCKQKIQKQYIVKLTNFINANVLMNELRMTYELPVEPYELWLNESANSAINKVADVKKKVKKNPAISKFLAKKTTMTPNTPMGPLDNTTPSGSNVQISMVRRVPMTMLYRSYMPLNDRIPPNKCLQYLKEYQIFNFNLINNLRNTYLFQKFYENNHVIFHFEEKEDQNLIKQIQQENKELKEIRCKKYLVYYAFCLNPLIEKKAIEKNITPHIKEVLHKQMFDDVSRFLLVNPNIVPQFEQSFIKRKQTDEKKEFKIQLPNFYHKDHMIKFIIQHLEVYHYRVEFKSQVQKTKLKNDSKTETKTQIKNQNTLQVPKFLQSFRYVDSTVKQQGSLHEIHLDKRNSFKEQGSEYGSFLYNSTSLDRKSFMQSSTSMNSSRIKSSQSFLQNNSSQHFFQIVEYTWLFNCEKPKLALIEKYGKCLYFLKLKVKDEVNKFLERDIWEVEKHNYYFTKSQIQLDSHDFKAYFSRRNSAKNTKRDVSYKSYLSLQIPQYVGTPYFGKIEQSFHFIVRSCVAETYFENYIRKIYSHISKQYAVFKEEKKKAVESKQKDVFILQKVWPMMVHVGSEFVQVIEQVESLVFFKYESNQKIIIKDKSIYFLHFLEEFMTIMTQVKKLYKIKEELNVMILIYGTLEQGGYSFMFGDIMNMQKIKNQIKAAMQINKYTKFTFLISDYLQNIKNLLFCNTKSSFSKGDVFSQMMGFNLNNLKYFKDYHNNKQQFSFKRSMFVLYQITDSNFFYGSYNIKTQIDDEVSEYLSAIDCWLLQKRKILSLIQNIKENNIYQVSESKSKPERKGDIFYKLRKLEQTEKKEKQPKINLNISMYRILINLIFKDLPQCINRTQLQKQQGEPNEVIKRFKYVHHHTQIKELLQILKDTPIDYKKYPKYRGNQSLLEKLGREYVSILRQEYGEKMIC